MNFHKEAAAWAKTLPWLKALAPFGMLCGLLVENHKLIFHCRCHARHARCQRCQPAHEQRWHSHRPRLPDLQRILSVSCTDLTPRTFPYTLNFCDSFCGSVERLARLIRLVSRGVCTSRAVLLVFLISFYYLRAFVSCS